MNLLKEICNATGEQRTDTLSKVHGELDKSIVKELKNLNGFEDFLIF